MNPCPWLKVHQPQQKHYSKRIAGISAPKAEYNIAHNELEPYSTALVLNCCAQFNLKLFQP